MSVQICKKTKIGYTYICLFFNALMRKKPDKQSKQSSSRLSRKADTAKLAAAAVGVAFAMSGEAAPIHETPPPAASISAPSQSELLRKKD